MVLYLIKSIFNSTVSCKMSKAVSTEQKSHFTTVSTGLCSNINRFDILSKRGRCCQLASIVTLTMIPIICLTVTTSYRVADVIEETSVKRTIQNGIEFSLETGNVVHSTQIERGTSAMYLSSNQDAIVLQSLEGKYLDTDKSVGNLSSWPAISSNDPIHFQSRATYVAKIQEYRNRVLTNNVTVQEIIRLYTEDNSVIIGWVAQSVRLSVSGELWRALVAYHLLLLAKDMAGVERALGSTLYAKGSFTQEELIQYIDKRVTAEHLLDISGTYSGEIRTMLQNGLTGTELSRVLSAMRQEISTNSPSVVSARASLIWFDNMTSYINILKDIQDSMGKSIILRLNDELEIVSANYTQSIGLLVGSILLYPTILFVVFKLTKQIQLVAMTLKEQTLLLNKERTRTESLLCEMLPVSVARKLLADQKVEPMLYQSTTVYFSDIVGFTTICSACTPFEVVDILNQLYQTFDFIIEKYDAYKVETIGDAYMVVSGLPEVNGERHVTEISSFALDILHATNHLQFKQLSNLTTPRLRVRIGINTGPVVAGVVGIKMPQYCLFGDTVNVASRMESTGKPQRIQVSERTATALEEHPGFETKERGFIEIKGKGQMKTYWLLDNGSVRKASAITSTFSIF